MGGMTLGAVMNKSETVWLWYWYRHCYNINWKWSLYCMG
jgi:hypothetical protein